MLFDFTVSKEIFQDKLIFGKLPFTGNREKVKGAEYLFIMAANGQVDNGKAHDEKLIIWSTLRCFPGDFLAGS